MKKILLLLSLGFIYLNVMGQSGPGGVDVNDGSGNLKLWLRTDKNLQYNSLKDITEWVDYSGYNFTLTNSTVSPRFVGNTLNGLPVISFYAEDAGLEASGIIGSDLFSTQNNTIIFVKRSTSGSHWFNWVGDASNEVSFRLSSNKLVFDFNTTELTSTSDINDTYHILTSITNGTNQLTYQDGNSDGSIANGSSLNTALSSDLYLGSYDGTATNGWIGYIAEGIIFDKTLNTAEINLVENYLSAKYDLTISNDYYAGDDSGNGDYDVDVADSRGLALRRCGRYRRRS